MKFSFKNTKLYKILTGDTKTPQVSGPAVEVAFNSDLSAMIYDRIDRSAEFTVQSKDGKTFRIRQIQTQ